MWTRELYQLLHDVLKSLHAVIQLEYESEDAIASRILNRVAK
jgi:hypothetical protein